MVKNAEFELDRNKIAVLCVYTVQMEGRPTIDEITETINKQIGVSVKGKAIKDAVLAVKKRGLFSVNYDTNHEGGTIERYSMKDSRWSNPPEMAHIKPILSKFFENKETLDLIKFLETGGEEGQRKTRLLDIRDYVDYKLYYENIVPILGGEPSSNDGINTLRHLDGKIWLPLNLWLRSAVKLHLRRKNMSDSKSLYIEFTDAFIKPKKEIKIITKDSPPQRDGQPGTGLRKYEALQPGETFETTVHFPTVGFIDEQTFLKCLDNIHIGASHKDYGLLKLMKFEKVKSDI